MKKFKYSIEFVAVIVAFAIISFGCKEKFFPKVSIGVINNSNHDIRYYLALGGKEGILYPDTIPSINLTPTFRLARAGKSSYEDFNMTGKDLFSRIPSDTLSIFIFHPDTLALYDWETIRTEYKILSRYDLSYDDLERLGWYVYYPPKPEMDGVKIYSPTE